VLGAGRYRTRQRARFLYGVPILIRTDSARRAKALLAHIRCLRDHGVVTEFSVGWAISDRERAAIRVLPERVWATAIDTRGLLRQRAGLAEITDLLGEAVLGDYPPGMRVIVRRERPHPGPQLDTFEETADIITEALGRTVIVEPDLREPDYGDLDGKPWTDVVAAFGRIPAQHPDHPIAAGAETSTAYLQRATAALRTILTRHRGGATAKPSPPPRTSSSTCPSRRGPRPRSRRTTPASPAGNNNPLPGPDAHGLALDADRPQRHRAHSPRSATTPSGWVHAPLGAPTTQPRVHVQAEPAVGVVIWTHSGGLRRARRVSEQWSSWATRTPQCAWARSARTNQAP
jgi:hypothetical protein